MPRKSGVILGSPPTSSVRRGMLPALAPRLAGPAGRQNAPTDTRPSRAPVRVPSRLAAAAGATRPEVCWP
jgi:hypothetical protein